MKTTLVLLLGGVLLFVPGCDPSSESTGVVSPTEQIPGAIDGEFTLAPGVQGTAANVRVGLYRTTEEFTNRQPVMVTATDEQGRYFFTGVCCGSYYIDAWKDSDSNGLISKGDLYVAITDWNGCPSLCSVSSGVPASFCGQLCVVN